MQREGIGGPEAGEPGPSAGGRFHHLRYHRNDEGVRCIVAGGPFRPSEDGHFGMRAGRLLRPGVGPQKMATLACAQADYFGLESVRAGFCLTQEAEAFGCPINMGTEKSSPMLKGHRYNYNPMKKIYDEPDDLPDMDEFLRTGRIKTTLEAMGIMQKTHGEDYVVVGGNTGPFTLTGHLLNTENLVYSVSPPTARPTDRRCSMPEPTSCRCPSRRHPPTSSRPPTSPYSPDSS